jgi:AmpE protein
MNFLVILLGLTINYLWLKDLDRFDDAWFFRLRCRIEDSFAQSLEVSTDEADEESYTARSESDQSWFLPLLVIYSLPILTLALLLWFIADRGFGLPAMLVHLIVLLVAFDRTQPLKLASEFLRHWRAGDMEACELYLEEELATHKEVSCSNEVEIAEYFKQQLTYRCFEKMFVMFFWYMLTGPLGVMFNYISYQLRDSHREDQASNQVRSVDTIIYVLEWIPLRLLALTFSLAGNFVYCFESFKRSMWEFNPAADSAAMLYSYAGCAMSGLLGAESDEQDSEDADGSYRQSEARQIESLQALLERSQAIWLAVLALITIFGLQIA